MLRATHEDKILVEQLIVIRQAMRWTLRQAVQGRSLIRHYADLQDYLRLAQGSEITEQMRILYLDTGNRLLREDVPSQGTIDECPIYVREIVRRGLELGAAGMILVHNHPSGLAEPSRADKEITRQIETAARTMGMRVLDHLIVTDAVVFSFRAEGLL